LKAIACAGLAMAIWLGAMDSALADDQRNAILNRHALGLVASNPLAMRDAAQVARALDHSGGLRILPIQGRGSLQALNDLLFLDIADVAFVSSDSLAYARKQSLYANEIGKIAYLAKLGNNSLVLLARGDVNNINDLASRRVAAGTADSDSFIAADLVFGAVGVDIERVAVNGAEAIAALRDGRIDAALLTTAESGDALAGLPKDSGLHAVPLAVSDALADTYAPAILTDAEFPALIKAGQPVETVAAAVVLAVYDWPASSQNFAKLKTFNAALFEKYLANLSAERVTNFTAAVPGWKAYGPARESRAKPAGAGLAQFVAYRRLEVHDESSPAP
jgi:uncharacterized protein